jgi:cytochrome c
MASGESGTGKIRDSNENFFCVCTAGMTNALPAAVTHSSFAWKCMTTSALIRTCSAFAFVSLVSACSGTDQQANNLAAGDAERGNASIRNYGCGSCHTIPGVTGAQSKVGPDLSGIASRAYIAGVLTNSPEHMVAWIENPQAVDDKTAMPNMGVTARDARDIAAYLYTLR